MKQDSITTAILVKIGNKHKVASSKVAKIIDAYHKAIKYTIETEKEATCIKMDFFGKIIYNELRAKLNREGVIPNKSGKRRKDKTPIEINEINGFKF